MILLRSFLFSIWFVLATFMLVLVGLPLAIFTPHLLKRYSRLWSPVVCLGMPICGMRYVIRGQENLPKSGPMLIVSQHQSAFETMVWFKLVPDARYVMKIELMRLPLFGWLAKKVGQIGVERGGGAQTMRALFHEAARVWREGGQIVIFPEGTRAKPGAPISLKIGFAALAKAAKMPVIPVTTDSGRCWGKGLLAKRPGIIHVDIHPALPAGMGRDELMAELQRLYEEASPPERAV
jgi:1-acyl-sn-glycerol-3-phosphate acyltransferase